MSGLRQRFGRWGEQAAAQHLQAQGYTILAHNLRTEYGEIDLLASKDGLLIFVEVKARRSQRFGHPEEAVTPAKQAHLIAAAQAYMQSQPAHTDWRIDVVSIYQSPGHSPEIIHLENAVHG